MGKPIAMIFALNGVVIFVEICYYANAFNHEKLCNCQPLIYLYFSQTWGDIEP